MNKRAFSLLELLVAIVIIGILVAILSPVLSRTRASAQSAHCINNLRQLGITIHLYMDDNNYKFPDDNGKGEPYWFNIISNYIDNADIFRCHSYPDHVPGAPECQSYAYNTYLHGIDIIDVISSSQCMLITDSRIITDHFITIVGYGQNLQTTHYYITRAVPPGQRHFGGSNIVFVDGHASWHHFDKIPTEGANPDTVLWWND